MLAAHAEALSRLDRLRGCGEGVRRGDPHLPDRCEPARRQGVLPARPRPGRRRRRLPPGLGPGPANARAHLGKAHLARTKDLRSALAELEKALDADPELADALQLRGPDPGPARRPCAERMCVGSCGSPRPNAFTMLPASSPCSAVRGRSPAHVPGFRLPSACAREPGSTRTCRPRPGPLRPPGLHPLRRDAPVGTLLPAGPTIPPGMRPHGRDEARGSGHHSTTRAKPVRSSTQPASQSGTPGHSGCRPRPRRSTGGAKSVRMSSTGSHQGRSDS